MPLAVVIRNLTSCLKYAPLSREMATFWTSPCLTSVLKVGTSKAGVKAASSHTGSLAGADIAYVAAFKRADLMDNPAGIAKVIKDTADETNRILDENGLLAK